MFAAEVPVAELLSDALFVAVDSPIILLIISALSLDLTWVLVGNVKISIEELSEVEFSGGIGLVC